VLALAGPRKRRARFLSVPADRNQVLKVQLAEILIQVFGTLAAQVNPYLLYDPVGIRVDALWLQSGTVHIETISGILSEQRFRHLAASGIAGAQE